MQQLRTSGSVNVTLIGLALTVLSTGLLQANPTEARDNRPTTNNVCSCRCTSNETNPNGTPVASQARTAVVPFACSELNGATCSFHIPGGGGATYVGKYDRCGTVQRGATKSVPMQPMPLDPSVVPPQQPGRR